jgi:DNA polymerase-1
MDAARGAGYEAGVTLLLVDGHYYAFRSYHAIQELRNSRGEATNAVFGFVKALRKMLADVKADRVAVVFDGGIPERRLALQPEYKANREEAPDEFKQQMPVIMDFVRALGVPVIEVEGEEADDVMASYTAAARGAADVVLATNDKDIMQLVDARVRIYASAPALPQGYQLLGEVEVTEKWGVPPAKIGDVLALTGDGVDNIPGVRGIGPKTAAALVKEFGDTPSLLARLDDVRQERTREALRGARDQVESNLGMVRLDEAVPLPVPWTELVVRPDWKRCAEMARHLEFRGLTAQFESESEAANRPVQGDLFG